MTDSYSAPHVVDRVRKLVDAGNVELLTTHIQRDQVAAVSGADPERAVALIALFDSIERISVKAPLGAVVLGVSRWGEARWSGTTETAEFEANLRTRPVHLRDDTGALLCGGGAADYAVTTAPAAVTCYECREALGQKTPNPLRYRNTGDALLIETARVEAATFVTDEKPGDRRSAFERARQHGVQTMHSDDFFAWVLAQPVP